MEANRSRRRRLEVAVVGTGAKPVEEPAASWAIVAWIVEPRSPVGWPRPPLDGCARLAQRTGQDVDRQGCVVAEEVADHGRQHEGELGGRPGTAITCSAARSASRRRWR